MRSTAFLLIGIVGAASASGMLAAFAWRHRLVHGAASFAVLMLAVMGWTLAYAFDLSSHDLAGKVLWWKIEYLGIVVVPVAWLAFAFQFTMAVLLLETELTPRQRKFADVIHQSSESLMRIIEARSAATWSIGPKKERSQAPKICFRRSRPSSIGCSVRYTRPDPLTGCHIACQGGTQELPKVGQPQRRRLPRVDTTRFRTPRLVRPGILDRSQPGGILFLLGDAHLASLAHLSRRLRPDSTAKAAICAREPRSSFANIFATCRSTVRSLITSASAIARLVAP
jgi:hypothetical protein